MFIKDFSTITSLLHKVLYIYRHYRGPAKINEKERKMNTLSKIKANANGSE